MDDGQLVVEAGKWAHTPEYTGPDITELTLISWISLDSYDKTNGSALTLDEVSTDQFCGIVWAERVDKQWMSGSSYLSTEEETGEMLFITLPIKTPCFSLRDVDG